MRARAPSGFAVARVHLSSALRGRLAPLGNAGPFVSFTFDDFPKSALYAGAPVLEKLGVRATFYVSMGLMDSEKRVGKMFGREDLVSVAHSGHELGTHSFSHRSAYDRRTRVPNPDFIQDVLRGKEALRELIPNASDNLAYPYGRVTHEAMRVLSREMMSCRGTVRGLNGPFANLDFLAANAVTVDANGRADLHELISLNAERKGWLIFFTHDVAEVPSAHGCTPNLLKSLVRAAVRSGAKVLPVGDVLASIQTKRVRSQSDRSA
jgi:peptidoglycan/xylan/chitin deacetylase (PgdA/CDA1 family)